MNNKGISRLVKYFIPYKLQIAIIGFSLLFYTGYYLVIPLLRKNLIDNGFLQFDFNYILKVIIIILVLDILNNIVGIIKENTRATLALRIEKQLYKNIFNGLFRVKQNFYKSKNTTEIFNDIQFDINNIIRVCDDNVIFVFTQVLMFVGGTIGLIIIDKKMAFLVILIIPIKYIIMNKFSNRRKKSSEKLLLSTNQFNHWAGDTINGIKEIKLRNLYAQKNSEMDKLTTKMVNDKKTINILDGFNEISDIILLNTLEAVIYLAGAILILRTELTLGSLFAFVTYAYQVMDPISAVMNVKYIFQGIIPSSIRYHDLLDYCNNNKENMGTKNIVSINTIKFDQVKFSYNNQIIFNNLSFEIVKGDKVAICGKNGSGKSTIIKILLKLEEISEGKVSINNINLDNINLEEYRNKLFCLSQDSYIFDTTLENNIVLWKDVNKKINHILDICYSQDIYDKYKDKSVGMNGEILSSGEKQKLLFARALVNDMDLYIFDEATSNLDITSQQILKRLITKELKDKTIIIILHNDSILDYMNKIIHLTGEGTAKIFSKASEFKKIVKY